MIVPILVCLAVVFLVLTFVGVLSLVVGLVAAVACVLGVLVLGGYVGRGRL